jgi:hypothetical protein
VRFILSFDEFFFMDLVLEFCKICKELLLALGGLGGHVDLLFFFEGLPMDMVLSSEGLPMDVELSLGELSCTLPLSAFPGDRFSLTIVVSVPRQKINLTKSMHLSFSFFVLPALLCLDKVFFVAGDVNLTPTLLSCEYDCN